MARTLKGFQSTVQTSIRNLNYLKTSIDYELQKNPDHKNGVQYAKIRDRVKAATLFLKDALQ